MFCKVIFLSTEIRKTLDLVINQYFFFALGTKCAGILFLVATEGMIHRSEFIAADGVIFYFTRSAHSHFSLKRSNNCNEFVRVAAARSENYCISPFGGSLSRHAAMSMSWGAIINNWIAATLRSHYTARMAVCRTRNLNNLRFSRINYPQAIMLHLSRLIIMLQLCNFAWITLLCFLPSSLKIRDSSQACALNQIIWDACLLNCKWLSCAANLLCC